MCPRQLPRALALLGGIAVLIGCQKAPPPPTESGPPAVTVAVPRVEKVTRYADLTGQTAAVKKVEVRPRVSGFITRVFLKDGQDVEGEAALWGFVFTEGTVLFQIDTVTYDADLKQAEAQVGIALAKLELAQKNEAREKEAYDKRVSSQQSYEAFVAQTKVAVAELESARNGVVKAKQNLDWTRVTAPISGRADRTQYTEGNVVTGGQTQGTVLTTIQTIDPMYAYLDVDEQTVLYYRRLMRENKIATPEYKNGRDLPPIELQLKDETGYPHKGQVDFASTQLSSSTGSLQIRGIFPNEDGSLLAGLFVKARVPIGQPVEAVLVPDEAVLADQGRRIVYVVNDKNLVEARVVTPGPMANGLRVVEGLAPSERIVIKGFQRVRPGVTVAPEQGLIKTEAERMKP